MKRLIVRIDEEKCNGCGLCIPACAEGALKIVDGKARLVDDRLCDGLGACLGHCPQGAITVEEREADPFAPPHPADHAPPRTSAHAATMVEDRAEPVMEHGAAPPAPELPCGCPGAAVRALSSTLGNWPLQIHLVPPGAPFLQNADLVVAADCTAFACPDFHRRFLPGRALLVGCPKLDDVPAYIEKLAAIVGTAHPERITVVHMEVPCCFGMTYVVRQALARAGASIPTDEVVITVRGEVRLPSA
ncbi:MAG: 4Fe-4S binding protein [Bacillota bacterium]